VTIEHRRVRKAETEDALVVGLPDANTIIMQDLVYNRWHLFLGERDFDGWRTRLDNTAIYRTASYFRDTERPAGRRSMRT
jgi:hypothetical protein